MHDGDDIVGDDDDGDSDGDDDNDDDNACMMTRLTNDYNDDNELGMKAAIT